MGNGKKASSAKVELAGSSLRPCIEDRRRETREMFEGLSSEERDALAAEAWTAGLRAVSAELDKPAEEKRKPTRLSTIPPSRW
jgi:hypothetical protein